MVVSLNCCSQNGGNVYRAPYHREFRPIPIQGEEHHGVCIGVLLNIELCKVPLSGRPGAPKQQPDRCLSWGFRDRV